MLSTRSHEIAFETLIRIGELFYSGNKILPRMNLRLFPLVVGPTGAGKSHLVEAVARELNAEYLKLTRGDWLVTGCKNGRPTTHQILDLLTTFERVVVHFDELDKFDNLQNSDWAAAIASDLWNVLDGKFQIEAYLANTTFPGRTKPPTPAEIFYRIKRNLWVIGSGTWQSVFEHNRAGAAVGFGSSKAGEAVGWDAIIGSKIISSELLHRFMGEPLFLNYPTLEETRELLDSSGISELGRQLGITVSPDEICWERGGMRALETVATRLALALHKQTRSPGSVQAIGEGSEAASERSPSW